MNRWKTGVACLLAAAVGLAAAAETDDGLKRHLVGFTFSNGWTLENISAEALESPGIMFDNECYNDGRAAYIDGESLDPERRETSKGIALAQLRGITPEEAKRQCMSLGATLADLGHETYEKYPNYELGGVNAPFLDREKQRAYWMFKDRIAYVKIMTRRPPYPTRWQLGNLVLVPATAAVPRR